MPKISRREFIKGTALAGVRLRRFAADRGACESKSSGIHET